MFWSPTAGKSIQSGRCLEPKVAELSNVGQKKKAKEQDLTWQQKGLTEGVPEFPSSFLCTTDMSLLLYARIGIFYPLFDFISNRYIYFIIYLLF